jgi:hybrid cluster-associated redox disulfide protein
MPRVIITKDTRISDAIKLCPGAPEIFRDLGMGCCVCMAASAETIGDGAEMHEVDVQTIVDRLNAACE